MWNHRRPCKTPLEASGCIPTFRSRINAQKGESTVVSREWDSFLKFWKFGIWTTLCENNVEFYMRFTASFTHEKRVQEWPCRCGNDQRTSETSSEDVYEWIMNWILETGNPKTQLLAPIWPCEFCHFWLHYTTFNGIILHVLWEMAQEWQNLTLERWKLIWEERMRSYRCSQSWNP